LSQANDDSTTVEEAGNFYHKRNICLFLNYFMVIHLFDICIVLQCCYEIATLMFRYPGL